MPEKRGEAVLVGMASVNHPLLTVLRKVAVRDMIDAINVMFARGEVRTLLAPMGVMGLIAKGSATMPFDVDASENLDINDFGMRSPGDLDLSTFGSMMPQDVRWLLPAMKTLFEKVAEHLGGQLVEMDVTNTALHSDGWREVVKREYLQRFYIERSFSPEDIARVIERSDKYKLTNDNIALLEQAFLPEVQNEIVKLRSEACSKKRCSYEASYAGEVPDGGSIEYVTAVDIANRPLPMPKFIPSNATGNPVPMLGKGFTLDDFNSEDIWKRGTKTNKLMEEAPYTSPFSELLFLDRLEEVGNKVLSLLSPSRHDRPVTFAKDAVDLFLRLSERGQREQAQYIIEHLPLSNLVVAGLPAREFFYQSRGLLDINFKRLDPRVGDNRRRLKRGLRELQKGGIVPEDLDPEMLLEVVWEVCQKCFGVERQAAEDDSNRNPGYTYGLDENVQEYYKLLKDHVAEYKRYADIMHRSKKLSLLLRADEGRIVEHINLLRNSEAYKEYIEALAKEVHGDMEWLLGEEEEKTVEEVRLAVVQAYISFNETGQKVTRSSEGLFRQVSGMVKDILASHSSAQEGITLQEAKEEVAAVALGFAREAIIAANNCVRKYVIAKAPLHSSRGR